MKWYHVALVKPSSGFKSRTHLQRPKQVYKLLLTYCYLTQLVEWETVNFLVVGSSPTVAAKSKESKMEFVEVWNSLGYGDGLLFSGWLAVMYYIKSWIDNKFSK